MILPLTQRQLAVLVMTTGTDPAAACLPTLGEGEDISRETHYLVMNGLAQPTMGGVVQITLAGMMHLREYGHTPLWVRQYLSSIGAYH